MNDVKKERARNDEGTARVEADDRWDREVGTQGRPKGTESAECGGVVECQDRGTGPAMRWRL